MTIETNLDRIANALEGILRAQLPPVVVEERQEPVKPAKVKVDAEPTYVEQRKAEVKAEVKPVEEKKPRGRPVGSTKPKEVAPVVEPETEEDPFAEAPAEEVEEVADLEAVRAALVAMRTKLGKDKAYTVFRDAGKGASYLPGSSQGAAGGPGELKPENYAAVIKAAKAAMA